MIITKKPIKEKLYLLRFPTYKNYCDDNKNNDEEQSKDEIKHEFYRNWISSQEVWNIMSDYTSEDVYDDEKNHIKDMNDTELYIEVGEDILKQIKNNVRNSLTDKEIFELMPDKLKDRYDKLKKDIDELEVLNKV